MKVTFYLIALPVLAAVGFAQDTTPPAQPTQQPTETATPAKQSDKDKQSDKNMTQSADRLQEMKTQTYSGTLVDASCAGGASTAPTPAGSTAGEAAKPAAAAAPSDSKQGCALSASATQFALQTKDGQTLRFDDVGNSRVQEAMKAHKKWGDNATANKPVRVKVHGVLNGDKLTVMSVD